MTGIRAEKETAERRGEKGERGEQGKGVERNREANGPIKGRGEKERLRGLYKK